MDSQCDFVDRDTGYLEDTLPVAWDQPTLRGSEHEFVEAGYDFGQTVEDTWGESG